MQHRIISDAFPGVWVHLGIAEINKEQYGLLITVPPSAPELPPAAALHGSHLFS